MKIIRKILISILIAALCLTVSACSQPQETVQILATTLPVYDFTSAIAAGTGLNVTQLVNEPVSCLHNYTLQVSQMRTVEAADLLVISGAGFEGFLHDVIDTKGSVIDASAGVTLSCSEHAHDHGHEHEGHHHHHHDPHIWMSPVNAKIMAENIAHGLSLQYPDYRAQFTHNVQELTAQLDQLQSYGEQELSQLSSRDLITFHDGFHYMAESFDLHIVKAIEEEPGSETSAAELKELITFVREHHLPAIFTETNGSSASAKVISAETGCSVHALDMVMYGTNYFDAMYHNIDTIKEALG